MLSGANLSCNLQGCGFQFSNLGILRSEAMKSAVIKRSIVVGGHKTSVSLEDPFWAGLKEIANNDQQTLSKLVAKVDTKRRSGNLSSSLRMFVLDYFRTHHESRIARADGHDPSM
jgi:predicted DNA-binding ribbon-helix-helix protein